MASYRFTRNLRKLLANVTLVIVFYLFGRQSAWAMPAMATHLQSNATGSQSVATVQTDLGPLRAGPAHSYALVAEVHRNAQFNVTGFSVDGTWVQLCCHNGSVGWLEQTLVAISLTEQVPLVNMPTPASTPAPVFNGWKTSYFTNPGLAGDPVQVADLPTINLDWGDRAPQSELPVDGFSVRFERTLTLPAGYYRLRLTADDGVRLYLNHVLVVDEWHGASGATYIAERTLADTVQVRIDYFEATGLAFINFTYELVGNSSEWQASYFAGPDLQGDPWLAQSEPRTATYPLERRWPMTGSMATPIWSAHWTGRFSFEPGNYIFHARATGGVRVYLNEYLLLDDWSNGAKELANTFYGVGGETHTVRIEYYGEKADAVQVWWERQ